MIACPRDSNEQPQNARQIYTFYTEPL